MSILLIISEICVYMCTINDRQILHNFKLRERFAFIFRAIRGPGWLSGCTLLSHKVQSAGSNSRMVYGFIHPGLPPLGKIRIMAVTTERKDGNV